MRGHRALLQLRATCLAGRDGLQWVCCQGSNTPLVQCFSVGSINVIAAAAAAVTVHILLLPVTAAEEVAVTTAATTTLTTTAGCTIAFVVVAIAAATAQACGTYMASGVCKQWEYRAEGAWRGVCSRAVQ
jgi:hypothetical protein